jgi:excisionase family DNA binding protein
MDTAMVAELLAMSPVHIRRLARDGVIPAYRIDGMRAFKFKRDEILNWFEAQRVEAPIEASAEARSQMAAEARI